MPGFFEENDRCTCRRCHFRCLRGSRDPQSFFSLMVMRGQVRYANPADWSLSVSGFGFKGTELRIGLPPPGAPDSQELVYTKCAAARASPRKVTRKSFFRIFAESVQLRQFSRFSYSQVPLLTHANNLLFRVSSGGASPHCRPGRELPLPATSAAAVRLRLTD